MRVFSPGRCVTAGGNFTDTFEREVFHFYGERGCIEMHSATGILRVHFGGRGPRLTMDNAINFTSRSTPLVMDLQYVANGAGVPREERDSLPSAGLIRDKIASP